MLHRFAVAILLASTLAGCSGRAPASPAIEPTLRAMESLGYRCGDGIKDNVPNELFQWQCSRSVEGVPSTVDIDGSVGHVNGVTGVTLDLTDPSNRALVRREFGRLLAALPPLRAYPTLADPLEGWAGPQQSWVIAGIRETGVCDVTQCMVFISDAASPLQPIPEPS